MLVAVPVIWFGYRIGREMQDGGNVTGTIVMETEIGLENVSRGSSSLLVYVHPNPT